MKKSEAIEKTFEDPNYQNKSQSDLEKERLERRKEAAKPALLKRIAAGLLDFIFSAALFGLLFLFSYFVIFPSLGYQDSSAMVMSKYSDSGLYVLADGSYKTLIDTYDDNKTAEQNYDIPITHFYSTDERAIADNKLEAYQNHKLNSGFYELDSENNIVRKADANSQLVKEYLEARYEDAIDYLFSDQEVVNAYARIRNIMLYTILILTVISSSVFYFVVPLIDKEGCTFGYLICQVIPVSSKDTLPQKKGKLMFRSFIFVTITYLAPIGLFVLANGITFAFIPFFVNTAILCLAHSNSGLHDYGTQTIVINKSRTNAMQILKQLKGEDE